MNTLVYLLILLLLPLGGYGENEKWKPAPLDLRETYPIDLDPALKAIVLDSQDEPQRNRKILESKAIPWHAIAAIIFACMFVLFVKRRPKQVSIESPVAKSIIAHREALQILEELKAQKSLNPILVQEFVKDITLTLKYSFEEKFQLRTTIKTRQEFLAALEKDPRFTEEIRSEVHEFLEMIDKIKFAQYQPNFEECLATKNTAESILKMID